jgi:hypothetical protein
MSSIHFSFHGEIVEVYDTEYMFNFASEQIGHYEASVAKEKGEEILNYPMYIIKPDDYECPATFEQAKAIVPGITEKQYGLLMKPRMFLCKDVDLLPENLFTEGD